MWLCVGGAVVGVVVRWLCGAINRVHVLCTCGSDTQSEGQITKRKRKVEGKNRKERRTEEKIRN